MQHSSYCIPHFLETSILTYMYKVINILCMVNISQEWDDRLEDDSLLIERILLLIRNILHVPANKQAEKVNSCRKQNKLWEDRPLS